MRYLCLVYLEEKKVNLLSPKIRERLLEESLAYCETLREQGQFISTEPLEPVQTATTVRVQNGRTSTIECPFAETKEQLMGYFLIEARDLNDAIRVASKIPAARLGSIEVRPN